MHVKFYHRVCFQSTWRGGFEGGEHYYSPPGASPLPRGRHRKAGSRMGWTRPDPSSPGTERWLVTTPHMCHEGHAPGQKPWPCPIRCQSTGFSRRPEPLTRLPALRSPSTCITWSYPLVPHCPPPSPLESRLLGGRNVLRYCSGPI